MSQTDATRIIPWKPIEPLREEEIPKNGTIGALDALHAEWKRRMANLTEQERNQIKARSQRRLAVETGIIERLYELEWGLTLTLVAEGFGRDAIERAGGDVDDRTLATLRSQMDSIGMVLDFVLADRKLSLSFIKELHQAITRTQDTYVVTDSLGRIVETSLPKGLWKSQPNHVLRADGTLLEYAPPEQVQSEMDRLISIWEQLEEKRVHPIVEAAWLHHRFVQIHPFADGNGRVARALTLLVLEKRHFPPLVIDRWHRKDYLDSLEAANGGDLRQLMRLFSKLESAAIVGELERPQSIVAEGLADEVAHTLADQILSLQQRKESETLQRLAARATAAAGHIQRWFDGQRDKLIRLFEDKGIEAQVFSDSARTGVDTRWSMDERTSWYRRQIIESAHKAGHYANMDGFLSWSRLKITVSGRELFFVASLHGAGRDPGVMAVTTFAEMRMVTGEEEPTPRKQIVTTTDAFSFVHSEDQESIEARSSDLEELLDNGLAVALAELLREIVG
jgi:fido (protein-threonine AMPylation protein)